MCGTAAKLRFVRAIPLIALLGLASGTDARSASEDRVTAAQALVQDGKFDLALEKLEPLLKHDGENVTAQMTAVAACLGLRDAECAHLHLNAVEQSAPATSGLQLLRGKVLLLESAGAAFRREKARQKALVSEAADALARAVVESPRDPEIRALHADTLRSAGRIADARDAYHAWVAADPLNPGAYGEAAGFMVATDSWWETAAMLDAAPRDDPKLAQRIRLAVLRRGIATVPWAEIRPLLESTEAAETDPNTKLALRAYRAVRTGPSSAAVRAVLDYLDADPEDHLAVLTLTQDWLSKSPDIHDDPANRLVLPKLVTKVEPVYPDTARWERLEGKVVLGVRIQKEGKVGSIHVLASSNPIFESAAIRSVEQWKFLPATLGGQPIEFPFTIRVDFRLR